MPDEATSGSSGGTAPDPAGDAGRVAEGPGSGDGVAAAVPLGESPERPADGSGHPNPEAGGQDSGAAAAPGDGKAAEEGGRPARTIPFKERHTIQEFARALAVAKSEADKAGDRRICGRAAAILGINEDKVLDRLTRNPQLRALYHQPQGTFDETVPPTAAEVINRIVPDRSLLPREQPPVDLVDLISECDRELHDLGLKKMGLSDALRTQIKNLDGLAENTGKFISISLEKLSRSYYVQIMELMELAHKTRKRLMAEPHEPGYIADDEARAWFNRNYTEMVKEAGRAFELMLNAAQAMVEMMIKTEGKGDPLSGKKKKPGWAIVDAGHKREPMPN